MKTDTTKQRIQALVPSVMEGEINFRIGNGKSQQIDGWQPRPITLAIVLQAMNSKDAEFMTSDKSLAIDYKGYFFDPISEEGDGVRWNLEKDSYDEQSEETKRFLGDLLGTNE